MKTWIVKVKSHSAGMQQVTLVTDEATDIETVRSYAEGIYSDRRFGITVESVEAGRSGVPYLNIPDIVLDPAVAD